MDVVCHQRHYVPYVIRNEILLDYFKMKTKLLQFSKINSLARALFLKIFVAKI